MKVRLFAILLFLCPLTMLAQNDSSNFIHVFKKDGPVALQIIWVDNSEPTKFIENGIWLKAALECGTENFKSVEFKALSTDYRFEWEVESANCLHRLGLSFAQLKFELAFELLNEVLNKTAYNEKDLESWKKSEQYDFNYYKNDPDSLIKWWASGFEQYCITLAAIDFNEAPKNLISLLGHPQIVSSVGRLNDLFVKKELSKIVKTESREPNPRLIKNEDFKRERPSVHSFAAASIQSENPIVSHFLTEAVMRNNERKINAHQFSWFGCSGSFSIERNIELKTEPEGKNDDFYWERALVAYYLWLEFNKNEALANALFELGFWPNDLDKQETINASLGKGWETRTYLMAE